MGISFLIQFFLALGLLYAVSAMVAELVLSSPAERQLPPVLRAGFGYFLVFGFFTATWKFIPMQICWPIGVAFLALWAFARGRFAPRAWPEWRRVVSGHARAFLLVFFLANLFLAPLHWARNWGPFTEGGGDVSVYADTPKFLLDHRLPAFGLNDFLYDLRFRIQNPLHGNPDNNESFSRFDRVAGNPPIADSAVYRMVQGQRFPHMQYIAVGMWPFLAGQSNYHIFYATMAFHYALILLGLWFFIRPFGRAPALALALLAGASHALVSVYYNVYYLQGMSLAISALFLAALPRVRLFTIPGLRLYGVPFVILSACYAHFMAVLLPLLLFIPKGWQAPSPAMEAPAARERPGLVRALSIAFLALLVVSCILDTFGFIGDMGGRIANVLAWIAGKGHPPAEAVQMGDVIPIRSMQWVAFLLGLLSQQHFPPFASLSDSLRALFPVALAGAVGSLVLAAVIFAFAWSRRSLIPSAFPFKALFMAFITAAAIVGLHQLIAQGSM